MCSSALLQYIVDMKQPNSITNDVKFDFENNKSVLLKKIDVERELIYINGTNDHKTLIIHMTNNSNIDNIKFIIRAWIIDNYNYSDMNEFIDSFYTSEKDLSNV